MIAAGVAALVLAAGGYLFFRDGGPGLIGGSDGDPAGFRFDASVLPVVTTTGKVDDRTRDRGKEAGRRVAVVLGTLYGTTFVDDGSWGDYGAAWELFEEAAAERAEADVEILTLGAEAGGLYETLTPETATLTVSVLTDRQNQPTSAVAVVDFVARATLSEGGATTVASEGSYFLRQADGIWRIYAYRVTRDEQAALSPPSPSGVAP